MDNLDQITEKERIEEFLKYLLWLEGIPVVIAIRSEFVSSDMLREHREVLRLRPLEGEQLLAILERRLEVGCPDAEALCQAGLRTIAQGLAKITGNPLAFLCWLHYLCWFTPLRQQAYLQDLKGYVRDHFGTDYQPEATYVLQAVRWFFNQGESIVPRAEWKNAGLDDADIDTLERQGVLVPDDMTRPRQDRRYTISPLLRFLRFVEE